MSLAVARLAGQMSRLYLFDLGGAAAGCLLLIPLLDHLGAPNAVLLVSVLAVAAASVFASAGAVSGAWKLVLGSAALLTGGLLLANTLTGRHRRAPGQGAPRGRARDLLEVELVLEGDGLGSLADPSVLVMIDADAGTLVLEGAGEHVRHPWLAARLESLAYHLRPWARVLVIGAGGGLDVASARLLGAREVTAVEVNPVIARDVMSSEPFRGYSGRLYDQPDVRLVVDEARSFLRSQEALYDVIQATMVDTWAATAAGAFSLTENNLYTVEAFADFLRRLTPQGVLSVTRWYVEPPDQILRLASLARAAGRELGSPDVGEQRHRGQGRGGGRARARPRDLPVQAHAVHARGSGDRRGPGRRPRVHRALFAPPPPPERPHATAHGRGPRAVWSSFDRDLSPPRDNRPFFFHTVRLGRLASVFAGDPESRKTNLGTLVLFALLVLTGLLVLALHPGSARPGPGTRLSGRTAPHPRPPGLRGPGDGLHPGRGGARAEVHPLPGLARLRAECRAPLPALLGCLGRPLDRARSRGSCGRAAARAIPGRARRRGRGARGVSDLPLARPPGSAAARGHDRGRSPPWASSSAVPCPSRSAASPASPPTSCPGPGA